MLPYIQLGNKGNIIFCVIVGSEFFVLKCEGKTPALCTKLKKKARLLNFSATLTS